jgi:hypothetical protein
VKLRHHRADLNRSESASPSKLYNLESRSRKNASLILRRVVCGSMTVLPSRPMIVAGGDFAGRPWLAERRALRCAFSAPAARSIKTPAIPRAGSDRRGASAALYSSNPMVPRFRLACPYDRHVQQAANRVYMLET